MNSQENQRPKIHVENAAIHFRRLYSRDVLEIRELKSHADRNFRVVGKSHDGVIKKYVLKIMLSCLETKDKDVEHLHKQFEFMHFIKQSGFVCSVIQPQSDGKLVNTIADCRGSTCLIYLLEYLEGNPVLDHYASTFIPNRDIYELGQLLGKWRKTAETYSGQKYEATTWTLSSMDFVKERFDIVTDDTKVALAQNVVSKFESEVIPVLDAFSKGMIHGDFHDENTIVLQNRGSSSALGVVADKYGIIDFSDSSFAPFVFDLATSMCFFMIPVDEDRDFVEVGGHFLAGYLDNFGALPEIELDHLFSCICAAYVRELVIGESDFVLQEESNEYLLTSSKNGWRQLKVVWGMQEDFMKRINDFVSIFHSE